MVRSATNANGSGRERSLMSALNRIPVTVETSSDEAENDTTLLAVLHEIESLLDAMLHSGEPGCIDLFRAPLAQKELVNLRKILGHGEVWAEFNGIGLTKIQETGIAGVWWITHAGTEGRVLGELIEIAPCPELLIAAKSDIESGRRKLKRRIGERLDAIGTKEISRRLRSMGLEPMSQNTVDE